MLAELEGTVLSMFCVMSIENKAEVYMYASGGSSPKQKLI